MNRKMETIEGQPDVGSQKSSARKIINNMAIPEPTHESAPTKEAIVSGASEKLTMPSIE